MGKDNKWGDILTKKLAQTSGAALGFIHKDVPGAKLGWDVAGKVYDWKHARDDSGIVKTPSKVQKTLPSKKIMAKGSSTTNRATKALVTRSSMVSSGRVKVKRVKKVKVPMKLRKQIKQVMQGATAVGTYKKIGHGFIGNITNASIVNLTSTELGTTQTCVYGNSNNGLAGRTLFNQLVKYGVTPTAASVVTYQGLNYFTPAKILDAASVLFNNKSPGDPNVTVDNLSTLYVGGTVNVGVPAAPVSNSPGQLKVNVLSSSVTFQLKNLSDRVMTVEVWECTPTLKFQNNNALQEMITVGQAWVDTVDVDTNVAYHRGDSVAYNSTLFLDPALDGPSIVKQYMGFNFKWKKRSMVLAPEETCIHSIKGPSGMFDFSKIIQTTGPSTGTSNLGCLFKGWSVSCIFSCNGDLVLPTEGNSVGGRLIGATSNILTAPIAMEVIETYRLAVPEVAGFVTSNPASGSSAGHRQQLNVRKPKLIIWSQPPGGLIAYSVGNEVNPLLDSTSIQTK